MEASVGSGFDRTIGDPAATRYPTFDADPLPPTNIRRMTETEEARMDEGMDTRLRVLLAVALLSIIVGGTADLVMDQPAHWLSFHVFFEALMIAGALVMATTLWLGWWRSERAAAGLRASLEEQRAERDHWHASARSVLEGLGRAIDAQFTAWRLTPTEREVALLLLKGYGHKQIAALTDRGERTVRQHAGVVYEKSGLGGRAELSAYFLQDLMLPDTEREVLPAGPLVDSGDPAHDRPRHPTDDAVAAT
ncbi:MAG: helix-turn-helix transcriptional regulator [Gemmatimonadaceae bacterium]